MPMPMPTCPMGIFEYSFPWSMPSSLIQRRSWHWRKVFRGFSAHSVSPRLARTIANEVFVENFNCAITLVMGLVMVVVALLVMMFSIGYGVLYNGVHCDCHVDGHGIGQTLATDFFLHVTSTSLPLGFILRTSASNSHTHREARKNLRFANSIGDYWWFFVNTPSKANKIHVWILLVILTSYDSQQYLPILLFLVDIVNHFCQ